MDGKEIVTRGTFSGSHIWLECLQNTQRRERWESRVRPHGLEGHGEETVFNMIGKRLKTLDPIITLVDQFIHLYKCTMSTIGGIF